MTCLMFFLIDYIKALDNMLCDKTKWPAICISLGDKSINRPSDLLGKVSALHIMLQMQNTYCFCTGSVTNMDR